MAKKIKMETKDLLGFENMVNFNEKLKAYLEENARQIIAIALIVCLSRRRCRVLDDQQQNIRADRPEHTEPGPDHDERPCPDRGGANGSTVIGNNSIEYGG